MLEILQINSPGRNAMMDITSLVSRKIQDSGIKNGLCLLHVPHTTAGIIVNEGADPAVMDDIIASLDRLVPRQAGYKHEEGNSAAHIKAILVGGRTFLMIEGGRLMLGTWEHIFFCEFDGPRTRKVHVKIMETP